jgi:hypothetical protein
MDVMYTPKEMKGVQSARDSYSGRLLSDPHFDEAMMITGIVEKGIQATGRFKEVLNGYSNSFANPKKNLSAVNAEKIIRDLFKERTGLSMNEMRESFVQREENLTEEQRKAAFPYAAEIGPMIKDGKKVSFNRAFSHQAKEYATKLNITDLGAKRIMSEQFEAVNGEKLYDWGKAQEKEYYRPQIEAERAERLQSQSAKQQKGMSYSR